MITLLALVAVIALIPSSAMIAQGEMSVEQCIVNGVAVATPTPSDNPVDISGIEGIEHVAYRGFAASGLRLLEPLFYGFGAIQFESASLAERGLPLYRDEYFGAIEGDASAVRRASMEDLGDERAAYGGKVMFETTDNNEFDSAILAFVIVRTDAVLRIGVSASLASDPLPSVIDAMKQRINSQPTLNPVICDVDGLHQEGLWNVLPQIDDLPNGYVLDEENWRTVNP